MRTQLISSSVMLGHTAQRERLDVTTVASDTGICRDGTTAQCVLQGRIALTREWYLQTAQLDTTADKVMVAVLHVLLGPILQHLVVVTVLIVQLEKTVQIVQKTQKNVQQVHSVMKETQSVQVVALENTQKKVTLHAPLARLVRIVPYLQHQ